MLSGILLELLVDVDKTSMGASETSQLSSSDCDKTLRLCPSSMIFPECDTVGDGSVASFVFSSNVNALGTRMGVS